MILYNVTVKIEHDSHQDWKKWMQEEHIPAVMDTGMFLEYRMCRLLGMDEPDGVTYAVQYFCTDMATLEHYQEKFATKLQTEHSQRFKDKFVAFRTVLEVVDKGAFYQSN
jgi:hypothetical protein